MTRLIVWMSSLVSGIIFTTSAFSAEFTMTSDAFDHKGAILEEYTCDGQDYSPGLKWSGAPSTAKSFVLIVSDPDAEAGTWYHWVIYNMSPTTTELKKNEQPPTGMLGKNSYDKTQYNGPCPPIASIPHHYIFKLYALDTQLNFSSTPDARLIEHVIKNHVVQSTEITGIYKRK